MALTLKESLVEDLPIYYLDDVGENKKIDIHNVNGVAYFSLVDILSILSSNPSFVSPSFLKSLITDLDNDEYTTVNDQLYINQPGLYRLLSSEKSPNSKKLSHWLHHEVIPSLTKFGGYPPQVESSFPVVINTDGRAISFREFNLFINKLNSIYTFAVVELNTATSPISINEKGLSKATEVAAKIESSLSKITDEQLELYSNIELSREQELSFINIRRRNPIEIVFSCISIALVGALIVSGGKFELGLTKLKIELPPIGEGIAKIKSALLDKKSEE